MEDLRPDKIKNAEKLEKNGIKRSNFFKIKNLIYLFIKWLIKNRNKILKYILYICFIYFIFLKPKQTGNFFGKWYYDITHSFIKNIK